MRTSLAFLLLSLVLCLLPSTSDAQWALNGIPITNAFGSETSCAVIPDGSGGTIFVWTDIRAGGGYYDIYAQKYDAFGIAMWTVDGVAVCTSVNEQEHPVLCSDGAGGCIIAWDDYRTGSGADVYAQRISSAGVAQWTANGVLISNPPLGGDQFVPCIVADGAGGAIIAWDDSRNGADDIYAQRINSAGVVQWAAHGKSVCIVTGPQQSPRICSDGANGAIVTWSDYRGTSYDIYAQRMSSAGAASWTAGGVAVCTLAETQSYPTLVSDGAGGAIITWQDFRNTINSDIYAQRLNASGTALWNGDGMEVCTAASWQEYPVIASDGAGGAIIAWQDLRTDFYDVHAMRVSGNGSARWLEFGIPVCTASGEQMSVAIDSDGAGGAVLAWTDTRNGSPDVYAQRIDGNGFNVWDVDGVVANDHPKGATTPLIASDGTGGCVVAWSEARDGTTSRFYAQRIEGRFGAWGHPEPLITSVADVRPDQGGHVKVNWKASGHDALGYTSVIPVNYYTLWRATDAVVAATSNGAGNASTLVVKDPSEIPADFTGKATYIQKAPATDYYWELVGTQTALKVPAYSFAAETRADSVLGNAATHYFMVAAHTPNEFTHWPSNEMTGRSVDNLAPPAPIYLTAQRAGSSVVLKWNRVRIPDLRDYSIYRKTTSGVTPVDPNFLDRTDDSTLVDTHAPVGALYYIVTANDVHANRSAPSNEAAVSASTGAGEMPSITSLMVMQNRPNPFGTSSTFDIGLPAASRVEVEVFDVAGRRVSAQSLGAKPAGWQTIALDAADAQGKPLASGVYFYRIHAAGQSVTRKMVITR